MERCLRSSQFTNSPKISLTKTSFSVLDPAKKPGSVPNRAKKSLLVKGFLKKVLGEELGGSKALDYQLIITAIHAIMLHSGFVRFNGQSQQKFTDVRLSPFLTVIFCYTLPQLLTGSYPISSVSLKIQSRGKFIYVCGYLNTDMNNGSSKYYSVTLNKSTLAPILQTVRTDVWSNGYVSDLVADFFKRVENKLVQSLLNELSEQAGLACFMRLPCDLKVKILNFLPGSDLATASLLSREFCYLVYYVNLCIRKMCHFKHSMGRRIQFLGMRKRQVTCKGWGFTY